VRTRVFFHDMVLTVLRRDDWEGGGLGRELRVYSQTAVEDEQIVRLWIWIRTYSECLFFVGDVWGAAGDIGLCKGWDGTKICWSHMRW